MGKLQSTKEAIKCKEVRTRSPQDSKHCKKWTFTTKPRVENLQKRSPQPEYRESPQGQSSDAHSLQRPLRIPEASLNDSTSSDEYVDFDDNNNSSNRIAVQAFVEPIPSKFLIKQSSEDCDTLNNEVVRSNQNARSLNKSTKTQENLYEILIENEEEETKAADCLVSKPPRRSLDALYRSANGYSTLRRWNRTPLLENDESGPTFSQNYSSRLGSKESLDSNEVWLYNFAEDIISADDKAIRRNSCVLNNSFDNTKNSSIMTDNSLYEWCKEFEKSFKRNSFVGKNCNLEKNVASYETIDLSHRNNLENVNYIYNVETDYAKPIYVKDQSTTLNKDLESCKYRYFKGVHISDISTLNRATKTQISINEDKVEPQPFICSEKLQKSLKNNYLGNRCSTPNEEIGHESTKENGSSNILLQGHGNPPIHENINNNDGQKQKDNTTKQLLTTDTENEIANTSGIIRNFAKDFSNKEPMQRNYELFPEVPNNIPLDEINEENDVSKLIDEKFVSNIFKSRPSKKWKRPRLGKDLFTNITIVEDRSKEMSQTETTVYENENSFITKKDDMYFKMKKLRDMECVKMKEASSALWMIKNSANSSWVEELLAESILLETQLRYKLIVNKIRESKDMDIPLKTRKLTGSVALSNLQYDIREQDKKSSDSTTFYLLAISHGTVVLTTKAIESIDDNKLVFNETFTLNDLDDDFEIKAEVYSITLNTAKPGIVEKLLKRKPKCCCPSNKIYYENVNTAELKESSILKPSFLSCGEFTIKSNDIGNSRFALQKGNNTLKNFVKAVLKVEHMTLSTNLTGFLTLGKEDEENNIHYWERKWCSLNGNTFLIYNYPQDEEFDKPPTAKVNLEYCIMPLLKNPEDCARKKTFVFRTGRPSTLNDSNTEKIRTKENFVADKHYLSADNKEDFDRWTTTLDLALEQLALWNRLIFKQ
uniref:Uncharacterized protein LOC114328336 isoform X1 n=1 Tax=Diabrotica virgifera virgifera TaxID=50390 RepID=A0A6P7FDR2_DIAVI